MQIKRIFILALLFTARSNDSTTIAHLPKLDSSLYFVFIKLSGKSYQYKPGQYKKGKTLAFFVDKENAIAGDSTISQKLYDNNLFASDSAELKTVMLIYKNNTVNEGLIHHKADNNYENAYQICFIDIDSMCSRKIVTVNLPDSFVQKRELIARTIIDNFK